MQIVLTKERANFLVDELNLWEVKAKIIAEGENWITIEVPDDIGTDDLANHCFNIGVQYGRKYTEN